MVNTTQGFPKLNAALVDPKMGTVTQPWLQFFISLWNRTGGSLPSGQVSSVQLSLADGITGSVDDPTQNVVINLALGSITPSSVTSAGAVVGSNLSGNNSGDLTLDPTGQNYLTLINQVLKAKPVDVSTLNIQGVLAAANFPALNGDITTTAGNLTAHISNNAVTTATINAKAVTAAKMADAANNSLAGYDTSGTFRNVTTGPQLLVSGAGVLNTVGNTATITTAKLTIGGTNGSMTFTNGVLVAQTPAT